MDKAQSEYINLVESIMPVRAKGNCPLAMIKTYGCQQNVSDGEKIKGMLAEMGFSFTDNKDEADLILFNTCAIREHAEDRVFGNVGALKSLKRKNPSVLIALCGCMMEQGHVIDRIRESFPFVDLVFGTNLLHRFPELIYRVLTSGKRVFETGLNDLTITEDLPIKRDGDFKAWVPIMYGCDNFCTYCIVPYVRGRERSRKSEDILNEVKNLVDLGYKDITLLGQNVNSYEKNSDEDINFSKLLRKIDKIQGDYRIRFMTSHPKDATFELIDTIAESEHICNHLHLPFQSGSNRILKLMNRRYTREKYLEIISYAKNKIPEVSFTSDIIVGFPGETYEDFKQTVSLVKEVGFTSLFTFIFSKRKGTPAEKMDDPVPYETKLEWFNELLKGQEGISAKNCSNMVGSIKRVLVEGKGKNDGELIGRTSGNMIIEFNGDANMIGEFCDLEVIKARNWILKGKIV